ncbi:hypothetical protein ACLB2K_055807 [Fragaria x ananassa]
MGVTELAIAGDAVNVINAIGRNVLDLSDIGGIMDAVRRMKAKFEWFVRLMDIFAKRKNRGCLVPHRLQTLAQVLLWLSETIDLTNMVDIPIKWPSGLIAPTIHKMDDLIVLTTLKMDDVPIRLNVVHVLSQGVLNVHTMGTRDILLKLVTN